MLKKINNSKEELFPNDLEQIYFGMGCFWGAEKYFGPLMEFIKQQLDMLEVKLIILLMKKFVEV